MDLTTGTEPRPDVLPHDASRSPDFELPQVVLPPQPPWPEAGYRVARYAKAGLMLGALAGCTSLIVNVIGSVAWTVFGGEALHPLQIIQVYLTFPLAQRALQMEGGAVLVLGCLLYLGTGMLYGMLCGNTGRSMWWAVIILPYPVGWLLGLAGAILAVVEHFRQHSAPTCA